MVRRAYQVHLWNSHAQQDSVQIPRCDSQDCCLVLISAFLSPPLSFSHILPNSSCGQPPSPCPFGNFSPLGRDFWPCPCPPGRLSGHLPSWRASRRIPRPGTLPSPHSADRVSSEHNRQCSCHTSFLLGSHWGFYVGKIILHHRRFSDHLTTLHHRRVRIPTSASLAEFKSQHQYSAASHDSS